MIPIQVPFRTHMGLIINQVDRHYRPNLAIVTIQNSEHN